MAPRNTAPLRTETMRRLEALEKKYGRGPTYGGDARDHILSGAVPEWVCRGEMLLSGKLQERCKKARAALLDLHSQVWDKVRDQ